MPCHNGTFYEDIVRKCKRNLNTPMCSTEHNANWDDNWMFTIACGTNPQLPLLIVRKVLRHSNEFRCNSECWLIYVHCRVLVNIKASWYFQPASPHQVPYRLSHVMIFLTIEIYRNTFGISYVAIFVFTVTWPVWWTQGFPFALVIQHNFFTLILRCCQM
jgi:hypothetical protein